MPLSPTRPNGGRNDDVDDDDDDNDDDDDDDDDEDEDDDDDDLEKTATGHSPAQSWSPFATRLVVPPLHRPQSSMAAVPSHTPAQSL
jgi:hypothetical protein